MAIKSGQILHTVDGFILDRIQTGGPGQVSVNEETIYELGNYETVGTVRDIPDLTFDMESFDVSTEVESLLTLTDPTTVVAGDEFNFLDHCPIDVISPFKAGGTNYSVVRGIVVPFLTLESASYRFGVSDNATQSFSLRGDSIYYVPGSPRAQVFTAGGANSTHNFANTAVVYNEGGDALYALSVVAKDTVNKRYRRLFFGTEYTNTSAGVTVIPDLTADGYDEVHVTYGTMTVDTYNQTVHADTTVKPAAVRGKDIDVYVSDGAATPTYARWTGVQSAEINWSVSLDNDLEFGNSHVVSSDYDVPEVSGSVTVKSFSAEDLWDKIYQVSGVPSNEIAGALSITNLGLQIRVSDPVTGARLKTFVIDDAQFTVPGISGQVQTKTEVTFNYRSAGGSLVIVDGEPV